MIYKTLYMETWRNRHIIFNYYWQTNWINAKKKEINELKNTYNKYKNHIKKYSKKILN